MKFVGIPQRLVLSCVVLRERSDRGPRQLPGGPRGLLPRGSHGSGHADFPHPARQVMGSLRAVRLHA